VRQNRVRKLVTVTDTDNAVKMGKLRRGCSINKIIQLINQAALIMMYEFQIQFA
jgi:hypothetical protein